MQLNLNILGIFLFFLYSFSNHICNFIKLFRASPELATSLLNFDTNDVVSILSSQFMIENNI